MDEIRESRTDGDCFKIAAHLGTGYEGDLELNEHDEVHIVHGLPVGRGTLNEGKRFWHAWVEVTRHVPVPDNAPPEFRQVYGDEYVFAEVIDRSQGQDVSLPQAVYYGMGDLHDGYVWRFTSEEAEEQLRERGHYGPWVDGWEEMEEV